MAKKWKSIKRGGRHWLVKANGELQELENGRFVRVNQDGEITECFGRSRMGIVSPDGKTNCVVFGAGGGGGSSGDARSPGRCGRTLIIEHRDGFVTVGQGSAGPPKRFGAY